MSILVRRATSTDGPKLYLLWDQIRGHDARLDPRIVTLPVNERAFLAEWPVQLARPNAATLVAAEGDELAGFVTVAIEEGPPARLPERHATIGYLFVSPERRGSGVGRQLFEAARGWAAVRGGVEHMEMPVLAANSEAVGFWKAMGFSPFIERLWAPLERGGGG